MKKHVIRPVVVTYERNHWFEKKYAEIVKEFSVIPGLEFGPISTLRVGEDVPAPLCEYVEPGKARISHVWFEKFISGPIAKDYNLVILHITKDQRRAFGLYEYWNGKFYHDKNSIYEIYIAADRYDFNGFRRLVIHEVLHGLVHTLGIKKQLNRTFGLDEEKGDPVHHADYTLGDPAKLIPYISFERWNTLNEVYTLLSDRVPVIRTAVEKYLSMKKQPQKPSRLIEFAKAIEVFEDYVLPGEKYRDGTVAQFGSKSYRHRNPGNLRWSPFEKENRDGFSVFETYEDGANALVHQLYIAVTGGSKVYKPSMTLLEFFEKYAPSTDGNFPKTYATFVANRLGVPVDTVISTLI